MISIYSVIISLLWYGFTLVWIFSGVGVKKYKNGKTWQQAVGMQISTLIVYILFLHIQVIHSIVFALLQQKLPTTPLLGIIGIVLCLFGFGIAIWARIHLGKNWGTPRSLKEEPELVTSGPYAYVRHPIYTGVAIAFVGTILVEGLFPLIVGLILFSYLLYSAQVEEHDMGRIFSKKYTLYMKHTKKFIPFVY